ncbi:sentrin-specific protease 2 isoform X2 [Apus apus]|uniref:sentrin-specific protease 2 isoform X2 n=1 Tax=Apus apus TaxID=8895 RepID=UPI0021F8B6BE|nr:sentrin-specific protease 2 isoform X2 [Apus apus]
MYKWLLGALGALFAAARRPAPPPASPSRKRPFPSVQSPRKDPEEPKCKKQRLESTSSWCKKKAKEVSAGVKLPAKATGNIQKLSNATPITTPAEETQPISFDPSPGRPTGSALEAEMLRVDTPFGTNTCLTKDRLSLPHKTIPCLSKSRSGKHYIRPGPDSILTPRPPIKDSSEAPSSTSEAGKAGRFFCTAEEDVWREEKMKYQQLLETVKEKFPGSRLNSVPSHFHKCYTAAANSQEQGRPVKQAVAGKQHGARISKEELLQHLVPLLAKKPPALDGKEKKGLSSEKPGENFPPLTEAMKREVSAALGQGDPEEILSSAFRLKVTREDLQTLSNLCWLNDEVINFYMNLLMERNRKEGYPSVHVFSTFFYPKLLSGGHKAVGRWTRKVDLFKQDLIIVPIHLRAHWALGVIDVRKKNIKYFDSLGQSGDKICDTLFQYLQEESWVRRHLELTRSEWTLHSMEPHEIPQQDNGSDCGVFMCKYADYISRDKQINFTQSHMPYFRIRMAWEIIHQQLL